MKRTGLIIAVFGLFSFVQMAQADWSVVKKLTRTSGSSVWPAFAIDSDNAIHVVWQDDTPPKIGKGPTKIDGRFID